MKRITYILFLSIVFTQFSCKKEAAKVDEQAVLKEYLIKKNITVQPSATGLYYIETIAGIGAQAIAGNSVTVEYVGKFLDDQIFDSSYSRHEPFTFVLGGGNVIKGWDEGILKMKVGAKATLVIPSSLGYGVKGVTDSYGRTVIPGSTTIIFDVYLKSIN